MRRLVSLFLTVWLAISGTALAEADDESNWRRIDSRYCTMWLSEGVEPKQVNKRISIWGVRPQIKVDKSEPEEIKLAAKCDTILQRAEEILDMYPAGIHTTIRIAKQREDVQGFHSSRYGYGTEAIAFYEFEDNTIFVAMKDLSEGVLAHEMAHCIIDHYFRVRPPRKVEELLAMHVDEHLRD